MTEDLVQWLGVQLDEDERIANEAGGRRGQWRLATPLDDAELGDATWLRPPYLKHVERHDPARVLREVEAKRLLLTRWLELQARIDAEEDDEKRDRLALTRHGLDAFVYQLGTVYADRPGYREEWKP